MENKVIEKENSIQIKGISEELFKKALNIYFDLYKDRTKAIRELARATEHKKISISRDYLNDNRFEI